MIPVEVLTPHLVLKLTPGASKIMNMNVTAKDFSLD